jgi:leucyl-tRNA synthetase
MDASPDFRDSGMEGAGRFLGRVWTLLHGEVKVNEVQEATIKMHQTIKGVTEDIEQYKFNTAIAKIMEFVNTLTEHQASSEKYRKTLVLLLAPFAPHMCEEVWREVLKNKSSVHLASWPSYDEKLALEKSISIPIQVNGKVRSQITLERAKGEDKDLVEKAAREDEKVIKWLKGSKVKKIIFIPGRLINFVLDGKD